MSLSKNPCSTGNLLRRGLQTAARLLADDRSSRKLKANSNSSPLRETREFYKRLMTDRKRHINAFTVFSMENQMKGVHASENSKRLGTVWNSFTDEEKQPFRDKCEEYHRVREEKQDEELSNLTHEELLGTLMDQLHGVGKNHRKMIHALDTISGKALKTPWNQYGLFLQEHFYHNGEKCTVEQYEAKLGKRSSVRDLVGRSKLTGQIREVADKWNALSAEEKQEYRVKYEALLRDRVAEYREWFNKTGSDFLTGGKGAALESERETCMQQVENDSFCEEGGSDHEEDARVRRRRKNVKASVGK